MIADQRAALGPVATGSDGIAELASEFLDHTDRLVLQADAC